MRRDGSAGFVPFLYYFEHGAMGTEPEIFARLSDEMDGMLAEAAREERDYHLSPEAREQLRSLGYVN